MRSLILILRTCVCAGWILLTAFVVSLQAQHTENPLLSPRLLPGQSSVVFSLYGSPGNVDELESLIAFMKESNLGNGFDPGPGAGAQSAELLNTIAQAGWPVVCYPPDGGRMQVKGSTSVLDPAGEEALRVLDRAGQFGAIQLGEWGYHFHQLTSDEGWWKAVLGDDFEEQIDTFLVPREQSGFSFMPGPPQQCY